MTAPPQTERPDAGAGTQLECDLRVVAGFLEDWAEAEQGRQARKEDVQLLRALWAAVARVAAEAPP